jgi:hypothetical protein
VNSIATKYYFGLFIKMKAELNVSFVHVRIASTSLFHISTILGHSFVQRNLKMES